MNFMYGYTAASFSGRMPAMEIADAVVLTARNWLETTIKVIKENKKWDCDVIYGDTDSVFILAKGRSLA